MSEKDDSGVRVTMNPKPPDSDDEWASEFDGGGDATEIDPNALQKLRDAGLVDNAVESEPGAKSPAPVISPAALLKQSDSVGATDEFDDQQLTVMDPKASPDAEDSEPLGREPCPKCGVMVAPGYPKCPRCKAPLVESNASRKKSAGGTSVVGRTVPWTIVFLLAVATAVIVYLSEREQVVEDLEADDAIGDTSPADTPPTTPSGAGRQPEQADTPASLEEDADEDLEEDTDEDLEEDTDEDLEEEETDEDVGEEPASP